VLESKCPDLSDSRLVSSALLCDFIGKESFFGPVVELVESVEGEGAIKLDVGKE
jgi:hypothetical protein